MRFQYQEAWLETKDNKLYVVSKYKLGVKPALETEYGYFYKVLNAWEGISGWYWFQLEKENEYGNCFGFVQGVAAELGPFNLNELNELAPKVWKLKKSSLPYSGDWELPKNWNQPMKKGT